MFSGVNDEENNYNNRGNSDNDSSTVIESALPTSSSSRADSDLRSRSPPSSDPQSNTNQQQTTTNSNQNDRNSNVHGFVRPQVQSSAIMSPQAENILNEVSTPLPSPPHASTDYHHKTHNTSQWPTASEPTMPDTTYEEYYGDAYVGGKQPKTVSVHDLFFLGVRLFQFPSHLFFLY